MRRRDRTDDSLPHMVVTRDTSQASMAPCVEPALQSAPVPDVQGESPITAAQYVVSHDPRMSLHAPTHPNTAVCSALRSAGANTASMACRFHTMAMISNVTQLNRRLNPNEECMFKSIAFLPILVRFAVRSSSLEPPSLENTSAAAEVVNTSAAADVVGDCVVGGGVDGD